MAMKSFLLLLSLALAPFAAASWTKTPSSSFSLPAFPAAGSAAHKREYERLRELQESRSREDCALARSQQYPSYASLFGAKESPLGEEELEDAKALVSRVMRLTERVSSYFKEKFARPRPYDQDPEIRPCVHKPGGATAYPSSHAAASAAGACVLGHLYPRKRRALEEYGNRLGELRVIVGVHHPSDVAAGQALGREICEHLLTDEGFLEELSALGR